jgi:pyruvate ferredoxin oxidoreductase gamma subunit
MYRIRFHGRGGQGIKTASRILGSAFFHEGFEVQDAPRYGAERRGAPMTAYVRASRTPVRERSSIRAPDLVCVADTTLLHVPAAAVLSGRTPETIFLFHTLESTEVWKERLSIRGKIFALPANSPGSNGVPTPGKESTHAFTSALLAAGAARLAGIIGEASLSRAVSEELAYLGADVVRDNLEQALFVFHEMGWAAGALHEGPARALNTGKLSWIQLESESPDVAAPDIEGGATSNAVNTGLWRTLKPVLHEEHCHGCTWICSTYCPDSAIHTNADADKRLPVIDYDHCKGCMICSTVCPNHAIEVIPEPAA